MQRSPVIAIGLDALGPQLLEGWLAEGRLPTLARLARDGLYARQTNTSLNRTESSWLTLLQGCQVDTSDEWGHQDYDAQAFSFTERASYEFRKYPPFYALGPDRRVAIFDIPLTQQVPDVNGVQLLGWGTEVNQILRQSSPPGLLAELIARHGRHPLYDSEHEADDGTQTMSYRIPSIYDMDQMRLTRDRLVAAVHQRTAIILDLMRMERWDLLMCAYAEVHTAGHLFWHLSQAAGPLAELQRNAGSNFILDVVQAIDADLGLLLDQAGEDARIIVFSPHGMQSNTLDICSMVFLPELIYRWSQGEAAFAGGAAGEPLPPSRLDYSRHWREEVWDQRTPHGQAVLESPYEQEAMDDPLDWDPGNWYRRQWPAMRAFSLPGYSEGLVRINVAGRDAAQGIAPEDFQRVGDEIARMLGELVDARSGEPMAEEIIRVRQTPWDGANLSAADLMVVWREIETDVVDHPVHGRIGPMPFFRTGGHSCEGFVLARGPGFEAGRRLPPVTTEDVTATLLQQLGAAIPAHVKGVPFG
ncbi:alkaline phosphatase family protein [Ramlibacter sp. WS9]|uniref:alkaline phosphatase family protein n=1 Tax=Ramlibacter sp. WS9 TaxID=1882741 RepID=UPI0011737499|nr:alkaline phosphatase family protein [Ramlibacter sp. WS9]ROZ69429.1 hypothetical protein EEB15_23240 [Ramlibacter sp. WS9]